MKRVMISFAALLLCVGIGSTAKAQTPAQMAKYQAQYAKNYARYQQYMMTHQGIPPQFAGQTTGYFPSYMTGYPGQSYPGAYPYSTQQLASNPLMAMVAPFLGGYPGGQGYGGGYGGGIPVSQPYYGGSNYAAGAPYGEDDDDFEGHHRHRHHHFDFDGGGYGSYGGGYGPYGAGYGPGEEFEEHHHHFDHDGAGYGPYGSGGYGPYGGAGYGPYARPPVAQPFHHHFGQNPGLPRFNRPAVFAASAGAGSHGWASHPMAFAGGARRWGGHH